MFGCGCCRAKKSDSSKEVSVETIQKALQSNKKLLIWIFGAPGSGKGTQAKKLCAHFKLAHLSSGNLLREAILADDTPYTQEIKKAMENGELVDSSIVLALLLKAMSELFESREGYLIDGYPLDRMQGVMLCEKIGYPHLIIHLVVPDAELEERLLERGQESKRVDDTEAVIKTRLKIYHDVSAPILKCWQEKVVTIDGNRPALSVEKDCIRAVEELQAKLKS